MSDRFLTRRVSLIVSLTRWCIDETMLRKLFAFLNPVVLPFLSFGNTETHIYAMNQYKYKINIMNKPILVYIVTSV